MISTIIFNFDKNADISQWRVVNDGVMGGLSRGSFVLNAAGHAEFSGKISLDNNGGFSSVRYAFEKTDVREKASILIRLKGDKKKYQFRIKDNSRQYYSYIYPFQTSGEWETIQIPLSAFSASFRGRKVDIPNFSEPSIEEIVFLIGNKKAENFKLLIDKIELQ